LFAAEGIPRVADFQLTGGLFQGRPSADDPDPAGLAYLPPELMGDRAAEPRPHTDVYGLGAVLYELLTGRPPFAGATAHEVSEQVLTRDPDPPSRYNPEVKSHLDGVCLKCLRKNPWWRYARPFDLFTRLRDLLGEAPGRGLSGRLPDGR
jgi:serine/threonine protein kinase